MSACNSGDPGLILGLGRSPGEGNGNPLQYSCLENPMNGGAWWATVRGVTESDTTERLHALTHMQPARLLCPWDFPGKNTRVGCHFFLQWIFLTHGSNLCLLHLLHWQACSLPLAPPGKPIYCALVSPFWRPCPLGPRFGKAGSAPAGERVAGLQWVRRPQDEFKVEYWSSG